MDGLLFGPSSELQCGAVLMTIWPVIAPVVVCMACVALGPIIF